MGKADNHLLFPLFSLCFPVLLLFFFAVAVSIYNVSPALPDDNHQLGSAEQPEQEKKLPNQPFVLKCVTRFSNRSMNKPF